MNPYNSNSYALQKVASLMQLDPAAISGLSDEAILDEVEKDEAAKKILEMTGSSPSGASTAIETVSGGALGALGGYGGAMLLSNIFPRLNPKILNTVLPTIGGIVGAKRGFSDSRKSQAATARDTLLKILGTRK